MLEPPSWHARFGEAMIARRVMTAVLLLVAGIVSPGVCDACPQKGCPACPQAGYSACTQAGSHWEAAASNSDPVCSLCGRTGTAAVADSGCHGTPFSGQLGGSMEAGDGLSNSCDACRCMLSPRGLDDQAAAGGVRGDSPADGAIAAAGATLPLPIDTHRLSAADLFVGSLLPTRPARVLFGVWRN